MLERLEIFLNTTYPFLSALVISPQYSLLSPALTKFSSGFLLFVTPFVTYTTMFSLDFPVSRPRRILPIFLHSMILLYNFSFFWSFSFSKTILYTHLIGKPFEVRELLSLRALSSSSGSRVLGCEGTLCMVTGLTHMLGCLHCGLDSFCYAIHALLVGRKVLFPFPFERRLCD